MTLSHETLMSYYQTSFDLSERKTISISEYENMLPWERDVYITLLAKSVEENTKQNNEVM